MERVGDSGDNGESDRESTSLFSPFLHAVRTESRSYSWKTEVPVITIMSYMK